MSPLSWSKNCKSKQKSFCNPIQRHVRKWQPSKASQSYRVRRKATRIHSPRVFWPIACWCTARNWEKTVFSVCLIWIEFETSLWVVLTHILWTKFSRLSYRDGRIASTNGRRQVFARWQCQTERARATPPFADERPQRGDASSQEIARSPFGLWLQTTTSNERYVCHWALINLCVA